MSRPPAPLTVAALLSVPALGYWLVPGSSTQDVLYALVGVLCVAVALVGLVRSRVQRAAGWYLVLAGFAGWVAGDLVFVVEQEVLDVTTLPAPSDAVYIASYGLLAAGLVLVVRRRGARGARGAGLPVVLDATILATGVGVVAGVFLVGPIAQDSSLSVLGKLTSSFYPVADVLLLGILVQLWTTAGARAAAHRLLGASLALTLAADVLYNVTSLVGGDADSLIANDVVWLLSYVLVAAAVWSPSMRELDEPLPGREEFANPRVRLVVLTGGLALPGLTLIADGLNGGGVSWATIAIGSVALSLMVLTRMAGLLAVVRAQAVQLGALARADPLTGVPNRRTLDHELSRACQAALEHQEVLSVALLDLDHFKAYNDTHGHPAGDRLLREATAAWTALLGDGELLARYGGEEFVVLFPRRTAAEAATRVLALLDVVPHGQSFSAGVATWDHGTEPSTALGAADVALYRAKRSGRRRVCLAGVEGSARQEAPALTS